MIAQNDYNRIYAAAEKQSKMLKRLAPVVVRQVILNPQLRTLNGLLRWGAAEGAGERRGDVGSDDLLGRFFGRWFFAW
jgi:hypothetical protein